MFEGLQENMVLVVGVSSPDPEDDVYREVPRL